MKCNYVNLKSELIDSQKNNDHPHKELSDYQGFKTVRYYKKVRSGKSNEWLLWILQLVLEMLVNGTPPSAIPKNIASQAALSTPEVIVHDLPGEGYIRRCRTILRIVGETLTSYW